MMKEVEKKSINIIKEYLLKKEFSQEIDAEQLAAVYELLKRHDIAHLVGVVLLKNPENREKYKELAKAQFMAVMRYEKGKYAKEQIYNLFEENAIPFMPLKGAVICDYYPEPWHRTSCDIDILVSEENLEKATKILVEKLSFEYRGKSEHDISFYSPNGVHLELHYNFHEENISVEDGWKSASPVEGKKYHYALTPEAFILHQIAHTAKHFKYGGCGIRFFIDLWILLHNMPYDKVKLNNLIEEKGLKPFFENAVHLTEVWFNDGRPDEMTEKMADYILQSGIYGNDENRIAIDNVKIKSNFKYALSRVFQGYDELKTRYPILKKHRWLMPFCQVGRWFALLRSGKVKNAKSVGDRRETEVKNLLTELNLL